MGDPVKAAVATAPSSPVELAASTSAPAADKTPKISQGNACFDVAKEFEHQLEALQIKKDRIRNGIDFVDRKIHILNQKRNILFAKLPVGNGNNNEGKANQEIKFERELVLVEIEYLQKERQLLSGEDNAVSREENEDRKFIDLVEKEMRCRLTPGKDLLQVRGKMLEEHGQLYAISLSARNIMLELPPDEQARIISKDVSQSANERDERVASGKLNWYYSVVEKNVQGLIIQGEAQRIRDKFLSEKEGLSPEELGPVISAELAKPNSKLAAHLKIYDPEIRDRLVSALGVSGPVAAALSDANLSPSN